jgi:cobalamin biosynthesis Mg chelatase CobN
MDYERAEAVKSSTKSMGSKTTTTTEVVTKRNPKTNEATAIVEKTSTTTEKSNEEITSESETNTKGTARETEKSTTIQEKTTEKSTTSTGSETVTSTEKTKTTSEQTKNSTKRIGIQYSPSEHQVYGTFDLVNFRSYHAYALANTVPRAGLGIRKDVIGDRIFIGAGAVYDVPKKDMSFTAGIGLKF